MSLKKVATKRQKALEILIRLKRLYPDATCSLNYESTVQLLVATILSAQCTDERVNMVTPALFAKYPDAPALAKANLTDLENLVRSTGFYKNKSKNIKGACQLIVSKFGGEVPQVMEELLELPGVARKTANVVLGHGFGINMGVTVDTHVKRLTKRLGLTASDNPIQVERDLMKLLPQ
ncbi:MAG: endonuclease III, partial [Microcoleaceae cyanobacterium]